MLGDEEEQGVRAPAAASGVTALSSPSAIEPASGLGPVGRVPAGAALLALADRAEVAAGPDRSIDQDISSAVGERGPHDQPVDSFGFLVPVPPYTTSLDAAMALAKDFGGQVTFFKDGTAKAFLWQPYPMAVEGKAATPALALTAACLRALASVDTHPKAGDANAAPAPLSGAVGSEADETPTPSPPGTNHAPR